jgi:hypothetical protein
MATFVGNPEIISSGIESSDPPPTIVFRIPANRPPKKIVIDVKSSMQKEEL